MKRYATYKDSGIEWIGEIPSHWDCVKLKRLLTANDGGVWGEDNGDTIVLRSTEINIDGSWNFASEPARRKLTETEFKKGILLKGDLLVTKSSGSELHIGKTALVDERVARMKCCYSNFMQRLRLKNKLSSNLYFYFLNSMIAREQYNYLSNTTTGLANLGAELLANVIVPTPPSTEQTAIASYLDRKTSEIDQLISDKKRLLELYQEEKTALINQAVTKGISPDVKMKDSGIDWLGEIPEHWEVKRLKYVLREKLKYGANESAIDENLNHPRYIRITDFGNDGMLKQDTFKSLSPEKAIDYLLNDGDILFARSGATVGKTFQFKNYEGIACFAGYLIKASVNTSLMNSDFLYLFTKSGAYEYWKSSIFNQATIQNIGADKYASLELPVPPFAEQQSIVHYIETESARIDAKIVKTEKLIELLTEYRTALISEVVTGKIKVIK